MRHEPSFSLPSLTALVIASMIGAGVFTTSGFALGDLGTPSRVLWAWAVGGGVALCGALSYGALARHMTESGGEYLFLSRAVHPLLGFLAGWVSLLAGFTGALAFAATAFAAYALPDGFRPAWLSHDMLASLVMIGAGLLHGHHRHGGVLSQNLTVAVKLGLIVAFLLYALVTVFTAQWQGGPVLAAGEQSPPPFSLWAFAVTLMWISLSYSGFNAAIYVAGEVDHADVLVPRAMVVGTLIVTLLYLALNAVFVYAPAPETIVRQQDVAARAAFALGGAPLAFAVRVIIVMALLTSVSAMVMAGPRVYARMADDGVLPALFRPHGETPRAAIALQVVLAIVVIWLAELQELLSYLGFTLSLSAAVTVASLFVLRWREGAHSVPIPGYPFVPSCFVLCTLGFAGIAAFHRPQEPLVGLATIAVGIVVYLLVRNNQLVKEGEPVWPPASAGGAWVMDATGQQVTDTRTAGVIARPPLLFLTALLLGFVSDRLLPLPFPVPGIDVVHWMIAGSLILIGLALAAAGIRNFLRAGTPVPTNEPSRALVTTGIHGWTRNPIYLGMFLAYGGIGLAVRSPSILILTLPLAIAIRYGVVAREEAYLERRFGDTYHDYKARVRRWV